MIPVGAILFAVSGIALVAVLIAHYFRGYDIPKFDEFIIILGTVLVFSGLVSIFEVTHYIAYATVLGAVILMLSSFKDYPKLVTDIAMVLTLAGAVGTLLVFLV